MLSSRPSPTPPKSCLYVPTRSPGQSPAPNQRLRGPASAVRTVGRSLQALLPQCLARYREPQDPLAAPLPGIDVNARRLSPLRDRIAQQILEQLQQTVRIARHPRQIVLGDLCIAAADSHAGHPLLAMAFSNRSF